MCGIVGIFARTDVNQALYDALTVLQHRGQDAAGIVTCENNVLHLRKGNGLVRDVFQGHHMLALRGDMGIGHVRYPTAGCASSAEAQPFYVNSPFGITLAHNGNLINADELRRDLFNQDLRHLNTQSDSEILLNILAHELMRPHLRTMGPDQIFSAISRLHKRCQGAYAAVALIIGHGLVAFRDPYGIRPVVFGRRETMEGPEYMVASESVALDALGFELIRDLGPGEALYVDRSGQLHCRNCFENPTFSPCVFEYVYLARPDSIIDQVSVYKARLRMGEKLARRILERWPEHDIDVVIPIPDTSRTAALPLAFMLGVKYREGFIKNRYIGRTFIMPGQKERKKSVRQKLNAIELEFDGKNVLLVDDSIVRGTTSKQIIQMARDAGARKVYFASAAPPVRYPNVYGIDMPAACELVGHGRSEAEIAVEIGADALIYQRLDDLWEAVGRTNSKLQRFDSSCFDSDYVTGSVSNDYLATLERTRSDDNKHQQQVVAKEFLDLRNDDE